VGLKEFAEDDALSGFEVDRHRGHACSISLSPALQRGDGGAHRVLLASGAVAPSALDDPVVYDDCWRRRHRVRR
jgi:hypothetical protein